MKALLSTAVVLGFAAVPAHAKNVCDIHHLGYTKAQCEQCSNMSWSVSRVFPAGVCVSNTAPPPVRVGGGNTAPQPTPTPTPKPVLKPAVKPPPATSPKPGPTATPAAAPSCTLTSWGGATVPLKAPNFSGTGVPVSVCGKGYDLEKSQFHCSTGVPVRAFNYPNTNVSCNKTTAVGGNPQVTINGMACCLR